MTEPDHTSFVTTIRVPFALQAELDAIRMQRAARTGHRPKTRDIFLEALVAFVDAHAKATKTGRRAGGGTR